jgi:hypothetical protein
MDEVFKPYNVNYSLYRTQIVSLRDMEIQPMADMYFVKISLITQ